MVASIAFVPTLSIPLTASSTPSTEPLTKPSTATPESLPVPGINLWTPSDYLANILIAKWVQADVKDKRDKIDLEKLKLPVHSRQGTPIGRPKIGILGAGAAGLYAAMLLESLQKFDLGYDIDILEASEGRVGGRLYTHRFPNDDGRYLANDYFDVGAMRFPRTPIMNRVFKLFDKLNDRAPGSVPLIDYIFHSDKNIGYYNGKRLTQPQIDARGPDPFETGIPGLEEPVGRMVAKQLEPFVTVLRRAFNSNDDEEIDKALKKVLKYDKYSTRSYMTLVGNPPDGPVNDELVTFMETFSLGTGMYDSAFLETIMESLAFNYEGDAVPPEEQAPWFCVQGGSDLITTAMARSLEQTRLLQNHRVSKIRFADDRQSILVTVAPTQPGMAPTEFEYDHVISTLPFGCLETVDTSDCHFSYNLQTAIRTLQYGPSAKMGIRFSERWWEQDGEWLGHKGGLSFTDRPSRTIVYPSYGIDQPGTGTTMIASYSWAQDASRLGALARGHGTSEEERLKDLIIEDLALVHDKDPQWLRGLVKDYKMVDWYNEPNAAGAFAFFGPGQFRNLYSEVTKPIGGRFHFAGEATSIHHAWVVGALNSAMRSVQEILYCIGRPDLVQRLEEMWDPLLEVSPALVQSQVQLGRAQFDLEVRGQR